MKNEILKPTSRRNFLLRGTGAVAGVSLVTVGENSRLIALADDHDNERNEDDRFRRQLSAIASTADFSTIKQLFLTLLTEPALPALAAEIQTTYASSLTTFQSNYLAAFQLMTSDSALVAALISGASLTWEQRESKRKITEQLLRNPAIFKLLTTARHLRNHKNATTLNNYVIQAVANLSMTPHTPTTLGRAQLDAIASEIGNTRLSPAYASVGKSLAALMQESFFVDFLRDQSPAIVAGIIPPNLVVAMLLPNGVDPPLVLWVKGLLEIFGAVGSTFLAILLSPVELLSFWIVVLIIALGLAGEIIGMDDLFRGIDCDYDGDPFDTNDGSPSDPCIATP
jgi:hypothetical protein